jgi:carboxymethylenebutenolidase
MNATVIDVQTERGTMPVHFYSPDGDGPFPLVVLFMDGPGIRPAIQGYAERLADDGYRVALPDLYYAFDAADRPDLDKLAAGEGSEFGRMSAIVGRISDAEVVADTRLMLEAVPAGTRGPWGCVGFCMGGRLGLRAAETFGEEVAAASLLHPSKIVTDEPDSPHLSAGSVDAALYLGFGENDHVTPLALIPPLQTVLEEHGVRHRIEIIPGAEHGYMMPGMPAYTEAGAEQAWAATMDLLNAGLRSAA